MVPVIVTIVIILIFGVIGHLQPPGEQMETMSRLMQGAILYYCIDTNYKIFKKEKQ